MTTTKNQHDIVSINAFKPISTSTLGHLTEVGYLSDIRSQVPQQKMLGRIVTARIFPPDAGILRDALIKAQAGDVLAIECATNDHYACWGELRNLAAQVKKLAGVIVAGHVTDISALRSQSFPVFARGVSALTTRTNTNSQRGEISSGEINSVINIAGVAIRPGDIAIGDDDGVFVFSSEYASSLLASAKAKEEQDQQRRKQLLSDLS